MQLLQRSGCGGYVIAQDAEKGNVVVKDKNRQCTGGKCASYSYDQYKGRTMLHVCAFSFFFHLLALLRAPTV